MIKSTDNKSVKFKINKGFTLLEILLSIALIAILAGFSIPVYQSFQVKNDLDVATNIVAQSLRRAQSLSRSQDGDISWGVKIQTGSITLFKGTNYATRDSAFDELFNMPQTITPSGLGEIVFTKFSGDPQSTGNIVLNSTINETKNITINSKGMVNY